MKLPQISGKDLAKIFTKLGFVVVRQRGSHLQLEKITGSGNYQVNSSNASTIKERDFIPYN